MSRLSGMNNPDYDRQLQYEADLAAADLAESGYDDYHGWNCGCPYCPTDDDAGEKRKPR